MFAAGMLVFLLALILLPSWVLGTAAHLAAFRIRLAALAALLPLSALVFGFAAVVAWRMAFILTCHLKSPFPWGSS
jgi:hypothetical protein